MVMSGEIQKIRNKLISQGWSKFIVNISINGLHGLENKQLEFKFPISAIVGENGTCKSTILKLLACAYKDQNSDNDFFPSDFFPDTAWENLKGITIEYQIRQGQRIITQKIAKPTERWRGLPERLINRVYYFDLSRLRPFDSLIGSSKLANSKIKEIKSRDLSQDSIHDLSEVMGRNYLSGRYAITSINETEIGLLKFNFGEVSKFHQGTGEAIVSDFISAIENIPEYSFIVIDEIESSLHPKAQRRLIRQLLRLVRVKTLQIIFSTHSPYILSEIPPEARILMTRTKDSIEVMYAPSTEFCLSQIDDELHTELDIFVEDNEAMVLVSEIIRTNNPDIMQRIRILPVGAASVIQTFMQLQQAKKLPYNILGIVDADQDNIEPAIKLPGKFNPEKQVIEDIIEKGMVGTISSFFSLDESHLLGILEGIKTIKDSGEWVNQLAAKINMTSETLWSYLTFVWVRNCLSKEEAKRILDAVESRLIIII